MAAVLPFFQRFHDEKIGLNVGVSKVKLVSTSDTITVPTLANTNSNASSAQVRIANEPAVTVTDDGANTVTIVGSIGDEVTIVTAHGPDVINFGAEA
jgi:hypothetical protein